MKKLTYKDQEFEITGCVDISRPDPLLNPFNRPLFVQTTQTTYKYFLFNEKKEIKLTKIILQSNKKFKPIYNKKELKPLLDQIIFDIQTIKNFIWSGNSKCNL